MKDKSITLYLDDVSCGVLRFTDLVIEKDSYLYGGEEKYLFDVFVYYDDVCIFCSNAKKEILQIDSKLYIYSFED